MAGHCRHWRQPACLPDIGPCTSSMSHTCLLPSILHLSPLPPHARQTTPFTSPCHATFSSAALLGPPPGLPRTRRLRQGGPSLYACALSLRPCASVNCGKEGNTHQGLHWLLPGSPCKGEVLLPTAVEPTLARAPAALCRAREAGQPPGLEGCQLQLLRGLCS